MSWKNELRMIWFIGVIACGSAQSTVENAEVTTRYEAEQLTCVDKATTREESRACRCAHPADNGHVPEFCKTPASAGDGGVP